MKNHFLLRSMGILGIAGVLSLTPFSGVSANVEDTFYTYSAKRIDGDYKQTEWRRKDQNGSNTPYGYVYVRCATGEASSVMVRKLSTSGNGSQATDYVTAPYYVDTQIRNSVTISKYPKVRLRVRTNSNNGYTGGVWSPDSSKAYSRVVG